MAFPRSMRTALFFEELEPRLLFSADLAGLGATALEQDVAEEPAVTADLTSGAADAQTTEDEDGAASPATAAGPEIATEDAGTGEEPGGTEVVDPDPGNHDPGRPESPGPPEWTASGESASDNANASEGNANDPAAEETNAAPILDTPDTAVSYTPGEPVILTPEATVADADNENFFQGTLTVSISSGGSADDQLSILEGGDVSLLNMNIKVEQKLVGSFEGGSDGLPLIISWSPQATPDYAQAVLRQIAYSNESEAAIDSRTVDFILTDGDGGISNTTQLTVNPGGSGLPGGEEPGQGEGDGGGQEDGDGDGAGTPVDGLIDDPIDKPIDEPVEGPADGQEVQPEKQPEPVAAGKDQQIPASGQDQNPSPAVSDGSQDLTSPVLPALDISGYQATSGADAEALAGPRESLNGRPVAGWSPAESDPVEGKSDGSQEIAATLPLTAGTPAPDGAAPKLYAVFTQTEEEQALTPPEQPSPGVGQVGEAGEIHHEGTRFDAVRTTIGRLLEFLAPPVANAGPDVSSPDQPRDVARPADHAMIHREVEVMRQEMEEAFRQADQAGRLMVYTTTGASLSLTAGIARYLFGSGSLLSGFLATVPLWKGFDPVAILRSPKGGRKNAGAAPTPAEVATGASQAEYRAEHKAETMFAVKGSA